MEIIAQRYRKITMVKIPSLSAVGYVKIYNVPLVRIYQKKLNSIQLDMEFLKIAF